MAKQKKLPLPLEEEQAPALPDMVKADVTGAISHLNEIAASIQEIKATYLGLEIQGPDDAATAARVQEGYTRARNFRLEVEKRRKGLIAPALEYQRAVNDAADRIKTALEEVEQPLKARINAHEAAKAEAREAKRKTEEARMKRRAGQLFDLGSTYNGNLYQLGSAICLPDELADLPDEQWEQMVAKFTQERDILLAAKRRQEEIERQRQAEEAQRLDDLRQQQQEIERQKEELKKQTQAARLRERSAQLQEMGFVPYFNDEGKKAGLWLEGEMSSLVVVAQMREAAEENWQREVEALTELGIVILAQQQAEQSPSEDAIVEQQARQVIHTAIAQFAGQPVDEDLVEDMTLNLTVALNPRRMLVERLFASIRTAFEAAKTKAEFREALAQLEAEYLGAEQ
jgi:hypothetical protein